MQISILDKAVGIYLLWGVASGIFISDLHLNGVLLVKWMVITLIYLFVRIFPFKEVFLFLIVGGAVIQSVVAILQQLSWISSNHSIFPVTGFMGNPGQLGGVQAIAFIIALAMTIKKQGYKIIQYSLLFGNVFIVYSIVLSDSRAGLLASLCGVVVLFYKPIFTALKHQGRWLIPMLIVLIIGGVFLIYNYRSASVDARLLIWQVCAEMIKEKPVLGFGIGEFNKHYMLYQAVYFMRHPDSMFTLVADNATYPYCELLHIWIEQGIIGVFIISALMAFALKKTDRTIKAALCGLIVFSMFSYPSSVYGLLVLLSILLGLSPRKSIVGYSKKYLYIACISIAVFISFITFKEDSFYKEARKHIYSLLYKKNESALDFFKEHYYRLTQYRMLNNMSTMVFAKYPSLVNRERLNEILPNCENWCDIGLIFQNCGDSITAQKYFNEASFMIPSRFKPDYLMWKLYIESGDSTNAIHTANLLLNKRLKVENTFTLKAKAELRLFLDSL